MCGDVAFISVQLHLRKAAKRHLANVRPIADAKRHACQHAATQASKNMPVAVAADFPAAGMAAPVAQVPNAVAAFASPEVSVPEQVAAMTIGTPPCENVCPVTIGTPPVISELMRH